jgi:hypothetical protein
MDLEDLRLAVDSGVFDERTRVSLAELHMVFIREDLKSNKYIFGHQRLVRTQNRL